MRGTIGVKLCHAELGQHRGPLAFPHDEQRLFGAPQGPSKALLRNPLLSCRLEVQADVQKEIFPKDSVSLGAISDNASTRAMAGSIISSYNPQDR